MKPLGFNWDRNLFSKAIPYSTVERACFRLHKSLAEFVWDAGVLEGNTHTLPEVKTLLEGITVGGHKIEEQEQILNLAESHQLLIRKVKNSTFTFTKQTFCEFNGIVIRNEALEWGHFRGEGKEKQVKITVDGWYIPPSEETLDELFHTGIHFLEKEIENPLERALAFFLFGSASQFFFDGNKRTSRLVMNGILMSHGIDAVSIPAARALEFNQKMVSFYQTKDGSEIMRFLLACHPGT